MNSTRGEFLLGLLATISAVGPHGACGIGRIEQIIELLAVMHRSVGHAIAPHQLMPPVDTHVIFVTKVGVPVLLCPAGVLVLLAVLSRLLLSFLRGFARLHRRIVIARVALARCRNDGGIDDLIAHRQIALVLK